MTSTLIERLGEATGPDRDLDDAIGAATEFQYDGAAHTRAFNRGGVGSVRFEAPGGWEEVPNYTSSIDAALGLVERVLPGKWPDMLDAATAAMWATESDVTFAGSRIDLSRLPARICLAALRALKHQEPTND